MNFDRKSDLRIREKELKKIVSVVNKKKGKYNSNSHFVRCAIVRLLKEEGETI